MPIAEDLSKVKERIAKAAKSCGREPSSIKLVAVSKTKTAEDILEAINAGQVAFGENYAQELRDKCKQIRTEVEWHFIGHLQKNKIKYVLPVASWIHTIDSVELLQAIHQRLTTNDQRPINCLIEVNIANEPTKSGCSPENVFNLVKHFSETYALALKGLMCMAPGRPYFKKLKSLLDEINSRNIYPEKLTELSMGMSHDFEIAIEEGATIVRIGTAIFGGR